MLRNIDIHKLNALMDQNEDAKQIINQLLENHQALTSTISHEIRNPLTLISSSLQLIQSQHPEVKQFYGWEEAMEDVDFMRRLLEELSTFNNGNRLHLSVFSIERLLKSIAVSFAISLNEQNSTIEFSSRIPSDLGDVTGDRLKLEEVVLNLLRNAKEAVNEYGSIQLFAERDSDMIHIKISDTGCGIPAEHLESIFEPFQTYKPNGTGLGLALSQQIVAAHRGTISVDSKEGNGSTFTVTLPV